MSLIYTPAKQRYSPDDPFLQEGNVALRAMWLERDAQTTRDIELIRSEADTIARNFVNPIYCEDHACVARHGAPLEFSSTAAYQSHYDTWHQHVCLECDKVFPGGHWLQLHLDEMHNVFNIMMKERGEKIYQCFVETCPKRFVSPRMRRLHLIDKHQYPKYFPFDLVHTGTLSVQERRARDKQRQQHFAKQANKQRTSMDIEENKSAKATRRKSDIRQDKQPQLQDQAQPSDAMDIDQITSKLSRLKLPDTISFGRAKPSLPRSFHK